MYVNAIKNNIHATELIRRPSVEVFFRLISERGPVVFVTIEDSMIFYIACALVRAAGLRTTVGLSLEAKKATNRLFTARWLKERVLLFLTWLDNVGTLSIIPYSVLKNGNVVSKKWIYDPAFWDLHGETKPKLPPDTVGAEIISAAQRGDRPIILYLGSIDERKGFRFLVDFMDEARGNCQEYTFIAAGPAGNNFDSELLRRFSAMGGLTINRRLSEEEVTWLQWSADIFWACYPPYFDQSSGICGRAMQLGKLLIVRAGSVADHIMKHLNYPTISPRYDNRGDIIGSLCPPTDTCTGSHKSPIDLQEYCREYSISVLNSAIQGKL